MVTDEDKKRALAEYRAANAQRNILINAEIKSHQYPKINLKPGSIQHLIHIYPIFQFQTGKN